MGLLKKITNVAKEAVSDVKKTVVTTPLKQVQTNVLHPVTKVGEEVGRGSSDVLEYPGKFSTGVGGALGGGVGSLFSGVAPGVAALAPSLGEFIAAYADPNAYLNRKAPFPTTTADVPVYTQGAEPVIVPKSPISMGVIIAAVLGLVAIFYIYKKR